MLFLLYYFIFYKNAYWMVLNDQEGINPSDVLRGVRQCDMS